MSTYLIYKPEGVEPKRWEVDPTKIMSVEAEAIEKATGKTFGEWGDDLSRGSITSIHALLWILLKRETPSLNYDDVLFSMSEIDVEADEDDEEPDPKDD